MAKEIDLGPLLDVRQNQLSILFTESNSIDTKALAIIATDVAILVFSAQASLRVSHWWLGTLLVGGYAVSILAAIFALWPFRYQGAGVNLTEHPEYLKLNSEKLVLQLIADTERAVEKNGRLNHSRWQAVLCSFLLASISTLTLFVII